MSRWRPNAPRTCFLLPALITFKISPFPPQQPTSDFHEAPLRHEDDAGPVAWGGGDDAGDAAGAGAPPGAKGGGRADAAAVDAESD